MKRRLLALGCVLVAAGALASVAAACHSEITAGIDCGGTVTYTATAWTGVGANDITRSNSDVRVYVSFNNGSSYQQVGSGRFTTQNGFTFSGRFSAGSAASVIVKVQEAAHWGNGDAPAEARYATAAKSGCSSGGGGTTPTPPPTPPRPPTPPPAAPAPPAVPVPMPTITLVKQERVGATGSFVGGPLTASVGQTVSYQLVVRNTGTTTVVVTLKDDGCDAGTVAPPGPQAILPGASLTYTCSHKITAADGKRYVNTALAVAENAGTEKATVTSNVVANTGAPNGVLAATKSFKPATHAKAKKVTKRAKPARAVIRAADFTG